MIGEVTNHVWQSTLFAAAIALLVLAFRNNRATVRYWIWFSASIKFLVPFGILMDFGSRLEWAPSAAKMAVQIAVPSVPLTIAQFSQPFPSALPLAPTAADGPNWIVIAISVVWAAGFLALALIRFRGWLRIRNALRASTPTAIPAGLEVRSSPGVLEPGVVGFLRPVLLLPAGIQECLTSAQMEAVLAHELCHVRRRDNLLSFFHMVVEAVFWFHPAVWWIGAKLLEERERSCDEEVLRLGGEPRVYAQGILKICEVYAESPLVCVSGVTGSNLKKRIEAIMINRTAFNLNLSKKMVLAAGVVVALAVPVVIGIVNAPLSQAQTPFIGSSGSATHPQFQDISVKATEACRDTAGIPPPPPGRKSGGPSERPMPISAAGVADPPSPETLTVCSALEPLVRAAYVHFANGQLPNLERYGNAVPLQGGPAWVKSELYQINAKATGPASLSMMRGPMMQALLESRFQLKVHRESKEVPVYELTLASSGHKLEHFKEGSCVPMTVPVPTLKLGEKECSIHIGKSGSNATFERQAMSIDDLSTFLFVVTDRPVINRTGLGGKFNIRLEYSPDESTPGGAQMFARAGRAATETTTGQTPDRTNSLSIATAVERQLGLKLQPAKGSRDFLVIDSIERPAVN